MLIKSSLFTKESSITWKITNSNSSQINCAKCSARERPKIPMVSRLFRAPSFPGKFQSFGFSNENFAMWFMDAPKHFAEKSLSTVIAHYFNIKMRCINLQWSVSYESFLDCPIVPWTFGEISKNWKVNFDGISRTSNNTKKKNRKSPPAKPWLYRTNIKMIWWQSLWK